VGQAIITHIAAINAPDATVQSTTVAVKALAALVVRKGNETKWPETSSKRMKVLLALRSSGAFLKLFALRDFTGITGDLWWSLTAVQGDIPNADELKIVEMFMENTLGRQDITLLANKLVERLLVSYHGPSVSVLINLGVHDDVRQALQAVLAPLRSVLMHWVLEKLKEEEVLAALDVLCNIFLRHASPATLSATVTAMFEPSANEGHFVERVTNLLLSYEPRAKCFKEAAVMQAAFLAFHQLCFSKKGLASLNDTFSHSSFLRRLALCARGLSAGTDKATQNASLKLLSNFPISTEYLPHLRKLAGKKSADLSFWACVQLALDRDDSITGPDVDVRNFVELLQYILEWASGEGDWNFRLLLAALHAVLHRHTSIAAFLVGDTGLDMVGVFAQCFPKVFSFNEGCYLSTDNIECTDQVTRNEVLTMLLECLAECGRQKSLAGHVTCQLIENTTKLIMDSSRYSSGVHTAAGQLSVIISSARVASGAGLLSSSSDPPPAPAVKVTPSGQQANQSTPAAASVPVSAPVTNVSGASAPAPTPLVPPVKVAKQAPIKPKPATKAAAARTPPQQHKPPAAPTAHVSVMAAKKLVPAAASGVSEVAPETEPKKRVKLTVTTSEVSTTDQMEADILKFAKQVKSSEEQIEKGTKQVESDKVQMEQAKKRMESGTAQIASYKAEMASAKQRLESAKEVKKQHSKAIYQAVLVDSERRVAAQNEAMSQLAAAIEKSEQDRAVAIAKVNQDHAAAIEKEKQAMAQLETKRKEDADRIAETQIALQRLENPE
jgi:hypothetical protein